MTSRQIEGKTHLELYCHGATYRQLKAVRKLLDTKYEELPDTSFAKLLVAGLTAGSRDPDRWDQSSDGETRLLGHVLSSMLRMDPGSAEPVLNILFAAAQCLPGREVWRLTPDTVDFLLEEELPDVVDYLPTLPGGVTGLYIALPPGCFSVFNTQTGNHDCEGIYIVEDVVSKVDGITSSQLRQHGVDLDILSGKRGLRICAVGEARSTQWSPEDGLLFRDDALVWTMLEEGRALVPSPAGRPDDRALSGLRKAIQVSLQLLYALERRAVEIRIVEAAIVAKSPKKRKRAIRNVRKTQLPFKVISLSKEVTRYRTERAEYEKKLASKKCAHTVLDFMNYFWVKNPGESRVYGTRRNRKGTQLFKIAKVIESHQRGEGEGAPRRFLVTP